MTVGVFLGAGVMTREATLPAERLVEILGGDVIMMGLARHPVAGIDPGEVFVPEITLEEARPGILVLPGGFGCRPLARDAAVVGRIRQIASSCDAVLAISTGTMLLAATGLLAGHRAAGHWLTRDELAPFDVDLSDGPIERHGRLFTTSGSAAAIEAAPMVVDTILYGPAKT